MTEKIFFSHKKRNTYIIFKTNSKEQIGINHDEDDDKDIFDTVALVLLLEFWPFGGQFWPTAPPQLEQQFCNDVDGPAP